jgi:two-component system chemotaxis response regulator CheB
VVATNEGSVGRSTVPGGPYRVMVVDDSVVVRGFVRRWLEEDPDIKVIAAVGNGALAVKEVEKNPPEVIVLDIEMPEMDGLTALPLLVKAIPDVKVVMSSTLTLRNAEISLEALAKGAADYVAKPTTSKDMQGSDGFRNELREKVKVHGAARRRAGRVPAPLAQPGTAPPLARPTTLATAKGLQPTSLYAGEEVKLRPAALFRPDILAIGSSTGGPQALFAVFGALKTQVNIPVLITQHMPPTFTAILAEHIKRASGANVAEAKDGEPIVPGRVYVAPGDYHMLAVNEGGRKIIRLNQEKPENFCRPAVDPMFRSIAAAYGSKVLGVVLTGMGSDGFRGGQVLVNAGGVVIAQDEATSVVWGMPGAAATGGICSAVLPIDQIAPAILRVVGGGPL